VWFMSFTPSEYLDVVHACILYGNCRIYYSMPAILPDVRNSCRSACATPPCAALCILHDSIAQCVALVPRDKSVFVNRSTADAPIATAQLHVSKEASSFSPPFQPRSRFSTSPVIHQFPFPLSARAHLSTCPLPLHAAAIAGMHMHSAH